MECAQIAGATVSIDHQTEHSAHERSNTDSAENRLKKIEEILYASQNEFGAFVSTVEIDGKRRQDGNAFVTGLFLRHLGDLFPPDHPVVERALGFLQQCRVSDPEGAFGFWPKDKVPLWMPAKLAPDADDTAIVGLELMRAGLWSRDSLRESVCYSLLSHRVEEVPVVSPPWIVRGAFYTWLRDGHGNVVDCCANVNVLALLHSCDLTSVPGFSEAITMVSRAIEWAGESLLAARSLTPFYPDPCELTFALRHAVACGVDELRSALATVEGRSWARCKGNDPPVCSSAYGHIKWYCRALHQLRSLVGDA
jgi:hypothetical protein